MAAQMGGSTRRRKGGGEESEPGLAAVPEAARPTVPPSGRLIRFSMAV